jgi:hypothetical protein
MSTYGLTGGHVTASDLNNSADIFPLLSGQNFLAQKSPTFPATNVRKSVTGREIRVGFSDIPTWQFKAEYEFLKENSPTDSQVQRLFAFFCSRQGQFGTFYFYDPYDHTVTTTSFGTGDGSTTAFQLYRQVGYGTVNAFSEPVFVIYGTPTIYVAGVATTSFNYGSFWTINFTTAPASGAPLTWTGSFMFLCRFAVDQIDPAQMMSNLWSLDGLEFTSWNPL